MALLAAAAAAPVEYALALQAKDARVEVTLRPGEVQPQKLVEVLLDVSRPGEAGEVPLAGLALAATITGPGARERYLVRPLGDAGAYGFHWTPAAKGLWTVSLAPVQGAGPQVSFQVGAGVPMPASSAGHAVQASRVVVSASRNLERSSPDVRNLMDDLGRRWLEQSSAAKPDAATLKAMAAALRTLEGRRPPRHAEAQAEFDAQARAVSATLDGGRVPSAQECLQCHMKFRDGWGEP